MIISYTRMINVAAEELKQVLHFQYHSGQSAFVRVCQKCGKTHCETLTPVDVWEGTEESPDERSEITGQTLCEFCCLWPDIGGGWHGLTLEEMVALWAKVRFATAKAA